jgi:hypothetical protein
MRQIVAAPQSVGATRHLVEFSDQSRIVVDVMGSLTSEEKGTERVVAAAVKYSEAHPNGVLASIVVNLLSEDINSDVAGPRP